jgi:uncharacterized membrane protein
MFAFSKKEVKGEEEERQDVAGFTQIIFLTHSNLSFFSLLMLFLMMMKAHF